MTCETQGAPFSRLLTTGSQVVSNTAVEVPNPAYAGANFNPTTAVTLETFEDLHRNRVMLEVYNSHATEDLCYSFDSALTTANGGRIKAGETKPFWVGAGTPIYFLRSASDITVYFSEWSYQ